jgi:hypothetical protein
MIQSTCQYSLTNPRIGGVEKINLKINPVKNTEYASYTNAYTTSKDIDPSMLIPSREGSCGDPSIFSRLSQLVGKTDNLLATQAQQQQTKENFVSGYNTNSCTNLTGSNGGIISSCITDLSNNIQAISNYDNTIYKKLNQKINQNYLDISNVATNVINQNNIVNGSSTAKTTIYDPIDFDGNVMFGKTKDLKDAYLQDIQDSIFQQHNLYMIGSITAATLFITAIIIGRNS